MAQRKVKFEYEYPRPALTVDCVIITRERKPRVLLIQRLKDPFAGDWALPGGFVEENEGLTDAARRELLEETGVEIANLELLHATGDPGRDPRGWTVSVVYLARVSVKQIQAQAGDDAASVAWHPLNELPPLAFDHAAILDLAKQRLKAS
ncbi:MAG: NUDIX domain-containing protein [Fimbriiglobus sp.]